VADHQSTRGEGRRSSTSGRVEVAGHRSTRGEGRRSGGGGRPPGSLAGRDGEEMAGPASGASPATRGWPAAGGGAHQRLSRGVLGGDREELTC
jgi:hypothetical protein